ncbi:MAG: Guanylate kinase [Alphaproteobacteria bacterium ADurb.BinA280]|jgi:guanylate kinase|nr:guanylate kinase [Xanthomonadales bacterium]MCC6505896.1 guanylate kinase [Aquimonas sp.]OPZ11830.1 MAG: Guanylate kinase [Alphaproteobacteria bacterium ADurb.BinA280]
MSGCLFIVAAPSGAGKSSLVNALLAREASIQLSISYTSRAPRPGEFEGSHYHFVSRDEFEAMIGRGEFFEHAVVHGDLKGTARHTVERPLAEGRDVLLEIDYQGARQVRALVPDCVSMFILPPSRVELERRLRGRGQDAEDVIQRRLADSRTEIAHLEDFDYLLVNDVFERALDDLLGIVRAERLKRFRQARSQKALIDALLA